MGLRMRVSLQRNSVRSDVTIEVQAADNLTGPWETVASSALGKPPTGPGYVKGDSETAGTKTIEVHDIVNLQDAPQRFLRFRITR